MQVRKDGSRQAIIIESDTGWIVKTAIIKHDIIYDIDHICFKNEPLCIEYVKEFFSIKNHD